MTRAESSAVLLLSHGSRDPRAEYVVSELVSAVAAGTGLTVRASYLDFTAPAPVAALRRLATQGFSSVRIVPLLFTPGYHLTHDVPSAVAASGVAGRSGVVGMMRVSVAPPLLSGGRRERDLLLRALADRLAQAHAGTDARADALVLASAGSSSRKARLCVEGLAGDLERSHGIPVLTAFAANTGKGTPSPAQALEALSDMGVQRPAVVSLFVAPGRLLDSVAASCPDLPVADPLGVSAAFVELLVAKSRVMSRSV